MEYWLLRTNNLLYIRGFRAQMKLIVGKVEKFTEYNFTTLSQNCAQIKMLFNHQYSFSNQWLIIKLEMLSNDYYYYYYY